MASANSADETLLPVKALTIERLPREPLLPVKALTIESLPRETLLPVKALTIESLPRETQKAIVGHVCLSRPACPPPAALCC